MTRLICFFCLIVVVLSCTEKNTPYLMNPKKEQSVSFNDYFKIGKQAKTVNFNDFVSEFNRAIKLGNEIGDSVVLEIRIISSRIFRNLNFYRMVLNKNGIWTGRKRVFEYMTYKQLADTNFIPRAGWKKFENTIAENDIIHTGKNFLGPSIGFRTIPPRMYVFQILEPNSTHTLNYGRFYEYVNFTQSTDKELIRMRNIMNALF